MLSMRASKKGIIRALGIPRNSFMESLGPLSNPIWIPKESLRILKKSLRNLRESLGIVEEPLRNP